MLVELGVVGEFGFVLVSSEVVGFSPSVGSDAVRLLADSLSWPLWEVDALRWRCWGRCGRFDGFVRDLVCLLEDERVDLIVMKLQKE